LIMIAYSSEIARLKEVASRYGLSSISDRLEKLSADAENFKVKVLFTGGFNAGKTTLINAVIDRYKLLKVGGTPTTAIATELVYDSEEFVELFYNDGRREKCKIEDISQKNTLIYKKYVYHLENEYLKNHISFILVDMPGFDSNNNNHDKAIALYAGDNGNAYILCVSCEDGTIKASVAHELQEIRNYTNNIACVVTKADKSPEFVERVRRDLEQKARYLFAEDVKTLVSSSLPDYPVPTFVVVDELLSVFQIDNLYKQRFAPEIRLSTKTLINALMTEKRIIE